MACDVAVLIGHAPVRAYVLGERASLSDMPGGRENDIITDEEIEQMAEVVEAAPHVCARCGLETGKLLRCAARVVETDDRRPDRRVVQNIGLSVWSSGIVDTKDKRQNHELTSHQVSVKVITTVSPFANGVRDRVRILVQIAYFFKFE